MAITAQLVDSTPFSLRYLCTADGQAGTDLLIPNAGGVTPDLQTDAVGGPLLALINANRDGLPVTVTAGAMTQAQARALLNSDDAARAVLVNHLVGRAWCDLTIRSGAVSWAVDVEVDGNFNPRIHVLTDAAAAGEAYLDIHFRHTPEL